MAIIRPSLDGVRDCLHAGLNMDEMPEVSDREAPASVSRELAVLDRALCERLTEFGITRIADTTGLDRVGIPTCSCVKPATSDVIWVYSGKGLSIEQARVSAIMECVERTSALWDAQQVIFGTKAQLARSGMVWSPELFTERNNYDERMTIAWARARHARDGSPVWVPAELVFQGVHDLPNDLPVFRARTSNGLGAGVTREQAVSKALLEVMERDAVSCLHMQASHFGYAWLATIAKAAGIGFDSLRQFKDDTNRAPTLDNESLPALAALMVKRFERAELSVYVKQIPNDFGLPVFGAVAVEYVDFNVVLAAAGYGAELNSEQAVCSALLELAQSRATDLQGAREDCGQGAKGRLVDAPQHHWLATPGTVMTNFGDLVFPTSDNQPTVDACLDRVASAGLTDAAVYDFATYPGLSVVRVLVPEIETWHPTQGHSRMGQRIRRYFDLTPDA